MSNPSNKLYSSDISQLRFTDHRPSKVLYENVRNNNAFRLKLQREGNAIRQEQLKRFENRIASCKCEGGQGEWVKQFEPQLTICKK